MKVPTRRVCFAVAVTCLLMLVACTKSSTPAAPTTGSRAAAELGLRHAVEDFRSAINKRDLNRILDFYAPDGWQLAENGSIARTDAERRRYWQAIEALPIAQDIVDVTDRIELAASGDLAVQYGEFRQVFTDGKGGFKSVPQKFINSWRKGPAGQWQVIVSMATVVN
jgi:ketosteroid isomerase-like protein